MSKITENAGATEATAPARPAATLKNEVSRLLKQYGCGPIQFAGADNALAYPTRTGAPLILGGPESEPFAKLDSTIKETRNFPVFMVPDEEYPNAVISDFPALFSELTSQLGALKRIGLVGGGRMPAACHQQIVEGMKGIELVDITTEFVELRFVKSSWERAQ
ncbi:MAG: hypothetical protein WCT12_35455, partial [Verrucomicrobiota bacterium]